MISWPDFIYFALPALCLWISGAVMAARGRYRAAIVLTVSGIAVYSAFIILFWAGLHRPPMRTIGETRLWYSFFMTLSGAAVYARWRYRWILPFSALLAAVFIMINLLKPEIHDRTLMPALQSGWFVPHVTVYMFSYSVIGCAAIMGVASLVRGTDRYLDPADSLMYVGTAFLTFGMLSGALWAKAAWGLYWSWDPKETWAAVTWLLCLMYVHLRLVRQCGWKLSCILLILAFIGLQMCWYGVNWLPSAQESMHVY